MTTRIRRSLSRSEIEFPAYTADELYGILRERVEYAFRPRTIEKGLIKLVGLASRGDARLGIEILRKASKKAEARYFDIIGIKEIEKAIAEVNRFDTLFPVQKFNEHQKII